MDIQFLFKVFNFGILLPWLLMMALPQWKGTQWMVRTRLPVLIVAASYFFLVLWDALVAQGGSIDFTSFESIKTAFARDEVMLVGWLHYLAFDLFVGMWEFTEAQKIKMPHWLLLPCLFFTLMFGPIGFCIYGMFRLRYLSKKVNVN